MEWVEVRFSARKVKRPGSVDFARSFFCRPRRRSIALTGEDLAGDRWRNSRRKSFAGTCADPVG
jgi:hypothetical protein